MPFPRQLKIFTGSWQNIGDSDEELTVTWSDTGTPPLGLSPSSGVSHFLVGTDAFLETPLNISQCPDEQLLASLSMAAILAGGVLPGTSEYIDMVTSQGTKYFQTIIGNGTIKSVTLVSDPVYGPEGTVYDVEFQKVSSGGNVSVIRADAWTLSQYANRLNNPTISVQCIPGALHKQFGFKKSDLGSAGSANRYAVLNYISEKTFWV